MTFDKDLKEAIRRLPETEKDKLILRLLKKDLDLANRLLFELVSTDSKEDRRQEAKKDIKSMIDYSRKNIQYYTPGILLMYMRDTSGIVNEHVKITKDKYGEAYLHIFVLKEFLRIYNEFFKESSAKRSYTLSIYIVVKVFKIMVLLKKMHEDFMIDFEDDLEKIARLMGENPNVVKIAAHNGLDINWLVENKIPDNIADIEKDLRKQGYLK